MKIIYFIFWNNYLSTKKKSLSWYSTPTSHHINMPLNCHIYNYICIHRVFLVSVFLTLIHMVFLRSYLHVINCVISLDSRLQCDCWQLLLIKSLSNEYESSGTGKGRFDRPGAIGRRECHNIYIILLCNNSF